MSAHDSLILFFATYANVFLLGFNSKNIHQSRYVLAGLTSWGITFAQYVFVKYAATEGGAVFLVISGLGGSLGIMSAIWVHDHITSREKEGE